MTSYLSSTETIIETIVATTDDPHLLTIIDAVPHHLPTIVIVTETIIAHLIESVNVSTRPVAMVIF